MTTIYSDYKGNLRVGQIDIFLEISIDNYIVANKLQIENNKLYENKKKFIAPTNRKEFEVPDPANLERLFQIDNENYKYEIQGIISLVIFYEALINEIGMTELGNKYFKDNLDKLSIKSKWEIILKLVYNDSLNKNSLYYSTMIEIIQVRNQLVHYKTKIKTTQINSPDYFQLLKSCLMNIHNLIYDLKSLDSKKNIIYFKNIENKLEKLMK